MRPALVSPRVEGVRLAPSWAAVERVLWLAAVDTTLREDARDGRTVRAAYRSLRARLRADAPGVYADAPALDDAALDRWVDALRSTMDAGSGAMRSTILLWAAVEVMEEADAQPWGRIARAVAWLATALDGAVRAEAARGLDGEAAVAAMRATVAGTGRVATKLRAVMAETWRAMEGGR